MVLGELADDGKLDRGEGIIVEEVVEDRRTEHLDCRRGGEAGTFEDSAGGIGLPPTDGQAPLFEGEGDATHQRLGGVLFPVHLLKGGEIDLHRWIPFADEGDGVVASPAHCGDGVEVDGRRDDAPEVVVGVVATQLTAPCGGEEGEIALLEEAKMLLRYGEVAPVLIVCIVC